MTAGVSGPSSGLSGRRSQAARNDTVILEAAREVFLNDPKAPIAAVAERAGVGISALYRRYPGKEELLRQLCHDGLRRYIAEAEAAASEADGWLAFTTFLSRVVDADVHSLTVHLAGLFTPTPEMYEDAQRANALATSLVARALATGRLRRDVVAQDVGLVLEGCAAVRVPDPERTVELRRRYLAVLVAGLSTHASRSHSGVGSHDSDGSSDDDPPLPGPAPQPNELNWRWRR